MTPQTPTVGRIVFYKSRGSADGKYPSVDRAAIITDVKPDSTDIRVTVFNPEGIYFPTDWVTQGDAGGQWNWPVRV